MVGRNGRKERRNREDARGGIVHVLESEQEMEAWGWNYWRMVESSAYLWFRVL